MLKIFTKLGLISTLFSIGLYTVIDGFSNYVQASTNYVHASTNNASIQIFNPSTIDGLDELKEGEEIAVLAGGCFWGIENIYEQIDGVRFAASGYTGGKAETADYKLVSNGSTKHAEAVKVIYDPKKVSYKKLLEVFFSVAHDPTQLNRQGPDVGIQYRSAVFYSNKEQKQITENYIKELTKAKTYPNPIVTEVVQLKKFYNAEDYHQDYMVNHPYEPYIIQHDNPKIVNLRKFFPTILKK